MFLPVCGKVNFLALGTAVFERVTEKILKYWLHVNLPPFVPLGRPLNDFQFWPATPPAGVATEADDPRNRDPHFDQWTVSIQH